MSVPGLVLNNEPGVAHSFYSSLQVQFTSLHFLFLIIDASTGQEIEHKQYETHYHNDADREVVIQIKHVRIIIITLGKINKSCLFLRVSEHVISSRSVIIINSVDQVITVHIVQFVAGDIVALDQVWDQLVPNSNLKNILVLLLGQNYLSSYFVRSVVSSQLWFTAQQ